VAKTLGFEVLEFNASDVRSKNAIVAQVSDVVRSQALGLDGKLRKRVVIMDEVDGMGGSDRGGIPELIKVIKASSTPIICICNDRCVERRRLLLLMTWPRQERKIRSLATHCFDIRLRRPTKKMVPPLSPLPLINFSLSADRRQIGSDRSAGRTDGSTASLCLSLTSLLFRLSRMPQSFSWSRWAMTSDR
jgi:hypothetical protein